MSVFNQIWLYDARALAALVCLSFDDEDITQSFFCGQDFKYLSID